MNLTLKEIKDINNTIFNKFGIDYSNYSIVSYKNRLIKLIKHNNLNTSKELIDRIENDKLSLDKFTSQLAVPFTEMFRDPAMWRELRDRILPKINGKIRIFIPSCTSGEELISLLILLKEENILENAKITVSTCSKSIIDTVKRAVFTEKQMDLNKANYKRFKGKLDLNNYATVNNTKYYFDELIKNISFIDSRILTNSKLPTGQDIVLYRNKLIYYNVKMQSEILDVIKNSVRTSGYLIVGIMENIFISEGMDKVFKSVSKTEKIYKKKI